MNTTTSHNNNNEELIKCIFLHRSEVNKLSLRSEWNTML